MRVADTTLQDCLGRWLDSHRRSAQVRVLGLSGPQGCGKSTAVQQLLAGDDSVVVLGLDDFYLTLAQRSELAATICSQLQMRGPPGTHDVTALAAAIDALRRGQSVEVPRFDKVIDDRSAQGRVITRVNPPAIVLLEGWMVGAQPPADFLQQRPLNALEANQDTLPWRRYQLQQLQGPYAQLWQRFDGFLHVQTEDFATVTQWRVQQEVSNLELAGQALPGERRQWVEEFVQYYQRLTEAMWSGARCPGACVTLDQQRRVVWQSDIEQR